MLETLPVHDLARLKDQAHVLLEQQRWSEAIFILQRGLTQNPDDAWLLAALGQAYLQSKQHDRALKQIEQALRIDPTAEWPQRLRSILLLRLKRKREALTAALEAVKLAPHEPKAWHCLIAAQQANQRLSEAWQTALHLRSLAPEWSISHYNLAQIAIAQHDWLVAEHHMRVALAKEPLQVNYLNDLGVCLLHQKRLSEAISIFHQGTRTDPSNSIIRQNLKLAVIKYLPFRKKLICIVVGCILLGIERQFNVRGHMTILPVYVLILITGMLLAYAIGSLRSLRSPEFKQLPAEVQHYFLVEQRRNFLFNYARLCSGISWIILLWWGGLAWINQAVRTQPRGLGAWLFLSCTCVVACVSTMVVIRQFWQARRTS